MNNRLHNCKNPNQGDYKKVLCVCSAGLLRSPTAALVLSQEPYNFNTRSCGLVSDFALVPLDNVLLAWADEVVVMDQNQEQLVKTSLLTNGLDTPVINLNIPDNFPYRDPELMDFIRKRYDELAG